MMDCHLLHIHKSPEVTAATSYRSSLPEGNIGQWTSAKIRKIRPDQRGEGTENWDKLVL